jgi:predicted transcriptional regulator
MSDKQLVLDAIGNLPDEVTLQEISEKVEFLAAIQKGLDEIEHGETVSHAEVKRQLAQWLSQ